MFSTGKKWKSQDKQPPPPHKISSLFCSKSISWKIYFRKGDILITCFEVKTLRRWDANDFDAWCERVFPFFLEFVFLKIKF